jgi:hypothetical protein
MYIIFCIELKTEVYISYILWREGYEAQAGKFHHHLTGQGVASLEGGRPKLHSSPEVLHFESGFA